MKNISIILIMGILIRILVMVTAIHPDFRAVNLAGFLIAQKHEFLTFYDHISKLPRTDRLATLYGDDLFIYPPLAYLTHGAFNAVLYPIYPKDAFNTLINDIGQLRQQSSYQFLLVLLKIPYLIADIAALFLLIKLVPKSKRTLTAAIWFLNPISIYITYAIAQFDVWLALLITACLYFSQVKKNNLLAALCLGLAAGFKPFPLAFLPFLPGNKIKNLLLGFGVYALTLLPYLSSPAYRMYALMAGQSDKLLYAKIPVSGAQYLSLFVVIYIVLFLIHIFRKTSLSTIHWFAAICLLFYSISNYHLQWFMWFLPLAVLLFVIYEKSRILIVSLALIYIALVFSFDTSLNVGLFTSQSSGPGIVSEYFASLLRSTFAGISLGLFVTGVL